VHGAILAAADSGGGALAWGELYSLRDDFGMESANASEFLALAGRLLEGALATDASAADQLLWDKWLTGFHADCTASLPGYSSLSSGRVGDCYGPSDCDESCRQKHVCALLHGQVRNADGTRAHLGEGKPP
jgi:hypothetical protein